MTSVDSGVETGNDSNDSSALFELVQHDGQQQHAANEADNNNVTTVANLSIDMDNIKWPTEISWCTNLQPGNYENRGNSLENNLISSNAGKLSLPISCCHEGVGDCNQLKWYGKLTNSSPFKLVKHRASYHRVVRSTIRCRKNRIYISGHLTTEQRIRLAAVTNNIMLMKEFLRNGYSPNCSDDEGRSPLHHAAYRGYTDMVRILLENGANPNQRDSIGNTPLHLAAVTSKMSVVTLLLGAGTNIHLLDKNGYNPLQLALGKLKMYQSYKGDMVTVKEEMRHIVNMLMVYFQKQQKNTQIEMEMLSNFCSRLSLSNTSDQVQSDVKDLLTNINALNITS